MFAASSANFSNSDFTGSPQMWQMIGLSLIFPPHGWWGRLLAKLVHQSLRFLGTRFGPVSTHSFCGRFDRQQRPHVFLKIQADSDAGFLPNEVNQNNRISIERDLNWQRVFSS